MDGTQFSILKASNRCSCSLWTRINCCTNNNLHTYSHKETLTCLNSIILCEYQKTRNGFWHNPLKNLTKPIFQYYIKFCYLTLGKLNTGFVFVLHQLGRCTFEVTHQTQSFFMTLTLLQEGSTFTVVSVQSILFYLCPLLIFLMLFLFLQEKSLYSSYLSLDNFLLIYIFWSKVTKIYSSSSTTIKFSWLVPAAVVSIVVKLHSFHKYLKFTSI